jgi:ketosteroid isomerase-like protein
MADSDDIARARASFDAFNSAGVEAMLEYVHPDFEMETPAAIAMEPQRYSGHAGIRRYFDSFYEVMDEVAIEPIELEQLEPAKVLMHFRVRTTGRASGIETHLDARGVVTVRDGLMYRLDFLLPEEPSPAPSG